MPFHATIVQVLIASPSDLREERDRVEQVIHAWNALHAKHHGVVLLPVRWETNASAELGAPAQDVINRQIVDDCDVLVGFFWTRLGTPTERSESGTAEELQRFLDAGRPASLFVSRRPVEPGLLDRDQYALLQDFLTRQRGNGLIEEFQTPEELATQVERALTRIVREQFTDGQPVLAHLVPSGSARAEVRARHEGFGQTHYVILHNAGGGDARDVTTETRDADGGVGSWDLILADRPIDFMPPGGDFRYQASLDMGSPSRVNCTVRWTNPDDSSGVSVQTLGIF